MKTTDKTHPNKPDANKQATAQAATAKKPWEGNVTAAHSRWSKITEGDLKASGGDQGKLTQLVSEKYAISKESAGSQVRSFLTSH